MHTREINSHLLENVNIRNISLKDNTVTLFSRINRVSIIKTVYSAN